MNPKQLTENPTRDPDHLDRLITETETARLLGFTVRALQNWRVRGGGPRYVKIAGRSVRYRRRDLAEWVESNIRDHSSGDGGG